MVILSDCFRDVVDEGCLKVANCLAKKIKEKHPDTLIVTYKYNSCLTDCSLRLNPLFLNPKLWSLLRNRNDEILYIPFASNTFMSSVRVFILSLINPCDVKVLFALRHPMNSLSKFFLWLSRAQIYTLSKESKDFYSQFSPKKVVQLKSGCDTVKFIPVDMERKLRLREKYNIKANEIVVLHAGHINRGRNVEQLLKLDQRFHVIMLLSTTTYSESALELLDEFNKRPNTTVIKHYVPNVEEIYQLSDVYFFPVVESENCIDLPLSVLEAASCNKPIVCTRYGALNELNECKGLFFIDDFDSERLNDLMDRAAQCDECDVRELALGFDWSEALKKIEDERGVC